MPSAAAPARSLAALTALLSAPQAPVLLYQEQTPRYHLSGGYTLPSVTEALQGVGLVNPEWYTATSRLRGRAVHRACHYLDEGDLDWNSLGPIEEALGEPITPYVRAWERFKRESGFHPLLIEHPMYHPAYLYGGTLDRLGVFPDWELVVLDLKTGAVEAWAELQVAAYRAILEARGATGLGRSMALRLKPTGDYELRPFADPHAAAVFLNILTEHRWRQSHGYA